MEATMKRHTAFSFLVGIGILVLSARGAAAQGAQDITIGERLSLQSGILEEERAYWVYLPASYHDSTYTPQRYPVLYLLDGDAHFHSASGVVQFMSTGINGNIQIPEMIVVAIPNTNRTRDLTPTRSTVGYDGSEDTTLSASGGGETFLRFIRDELFPQIESAYRTLPYRVFVGHSFGGLLALHTLLERPDMFQAHVAIDPSLWWDRQALVARAEEQVRASRIPGGAVYISLANNPDLGMGDPMVMQTSGRAFARSLEQAPNLRSAIRYFEEEDHGSVPLISLYHGLLHIFEGYKPLMSDIFQRPVALRDHFVRVSDRLGVDLLPPEPYVDQWGNAMLMFLNDADKALALFRLNVTNYPNSPHAHFSLGEGYRATGDSASAVVHYERSLELNPDNEQARERIAALAQPASRN
jgi:predicted alpha/beta superfamily hydrolase